MLNYKVEEFIGTEQSIKLVLSSLDPTFNPNVSFLLHDNTVIPNSSVIKVTDSSDLNHIVHEISFMGNFSEGIYQATVEDTNTTKKENYLTGNLNNGTICLLVKTLNEQFDCTLFTQLEATKHFIMVSNRELAVSTYAKIEAKCVSCTGNINLEPSGTSICIKGGEYKII